MKKYLSYLLIITLVFGLLPNIFSPVAHASEADNNVWKLKDTLFEGRAGAGVAEVNGKFYVIGGASGSTVSNAVQEYDPKTNKWSNKASMPTARADLGVAVVDNKIYAIGGYNGDIITYGGGGTFLNSVEVYDTATDSWSTTTSMSVALSGGGTVAFNNKIYVVGGFNSNKQPISTVQEFDPATHTWSMKTNMPYALHHVGVTVLNDKIYVVGGGVHSARYNYLQEFDPNTNTWTNKAGMKVARDVLSVSALNGKIYAIGGSAVGGIVKTVEKYDPSTNTWSQAPDLNTTRWGNNSVTLDNKIYVIGGGASESGIPVNSIEVYSNLPVVPTNLLGKSGDRKNSLTWTSDNNAISYNVKRSTNKGGPYTIIATNVRENSYTDLDVENGSTYFYTVSAINAAGESENSNEISLTLFKGRAGAGVAEVNGKFYVIGGASGSTASNEVQEYDPKTNKWTNKANMPTARADLGVAVVDNKIYAIGGYHGNIFKYGGGGTFFNNVEVYDPATDSWSTTTSMPMALSAGGTVAFNNRIYVVGGLNAYTQPLSTVQEFDPVTHTWSTKKDMPYALHHVGVTMLNNKIYAVGGGYYASRYNYLQEFDPNTNTWTNKADMKVARNVASVSTVNGKIYAISGSAVGGLTKTVETYDPSTNTWVQAPDLNTARWGNNSVTLDNKIYVIGGGASESGIPVNSIEVYSETDSPTWKFISDEGVVK